MDLAQRIALAPITPSPTRQHPGCPHNRREADPVLRAPTKPMAAVQRG